MQIDRISDDASFHALRDEWNALLQQSRNNEITLTWEWLSTWWKTFRDPVRKLCILTARDAHKRLIGIAPFYIRTFKPFAFLPAIRQVQFLASGEDEADEICSDYLNFILDAGQEKEVLEALLQHVAGPLSREWDCLFLCNMRRDTPVCQMTADLLPTLSLPYQEMSQGVCFYLTLPESWDLFLAQVSSDLRSNIRRNRKTLSQEGPVDFFKVTDTKTLESAFETLIELHQKRWTDRGRPGVFSSLRFLAFHKTLLPMLLTSHQVQFFLVLLDQKPIAAIYNFHYNHKIYFYQSGTDVNLRRKNTGALSPGLLLHSYAIEEAIKEGAREYDFLAGDAPYKRRWTKQSREMVSYRVVSATLPMRLHEIMGQGISLLKKLVRRVKSDEARHDKGAEP